VYTSKMMLTAWKFLENLNSTTSQAVRQDSRLYCLTAYYLVTLAIVTK